VLASCGCVLDRVVLSATGSVWAVHGDLQATADRDDEGHAAIAAARKITLAFLTYRGPVAAIGFPCPVKDSTPMQAAAPAMDITRRFSLVGVGTLVLQNDPHGLYYPLTETVCVK
jgi:putative ABC transport system permease protein